MTCPFCGEEDFVEVSEAWIEDRAFTLETCCEASYEWTLMEIQHADRKEFQGLLKESAGIAIRSCAPDALGTLTLDYGLELVDVSCSTAKAFVRLHHRHNPPPVSWKWGYGIRNGSELIGVAMVGRTVARFKSPGDEGKKTWKPDPTIVEVNRVCVADLDPKELVWNACSMFYGAAAREAKRRGYRKIITYTLASEDGTALRACGWTLAAKNLRARSWNRGKRARTDKTPIVKKNRWERVLAA